MTYAQLTGLMGPTYPPRIIGNLALVQYDQVAPISFLFEYSDKEFKETSTELTQEMLLTKDNRLIKVNMVQDPDSAFTSVRKGKVKDVISMCS